MVGAERVQGDEDEVPRSRLGAAALRSQDRAGEHRRRKKTGGFRYQQFSLHPSDASARLDTGVIIENFSAVVKDGTRNFWKRSGLWDRV